MEALGKFMNAFNKKGMEMQRKSIQKEWVGVNSTYCKKSFPRACQL
jgi:hypothetical protein